MTTDDVLQLVLIASDDAGRCFDTTETESWPDGVLDELCSMGLLRTAPGSTRVQCPACDDGHEESIVTQVGHDGVQGCFIWCPEHLRVEVQPELCVRWQMHTEGLAACVARELSLSGTPKPVVPGRLWRLGRTPWKGGTREVKLALRLGDDDGGAIAAHIGPQGRTIVIVPHHVPDTHLWRGRVPAVIPLSQVASIEDDAFSIDVLAMSHIVMEHDLASESREMLRLGASGKLSVRRQVKAEIGSLLADDALVAAYKDHGSYRKAAEALTQQLGQKIGKDKVRRAVERNGGVSQVMADADSASVSRRVASQPRDRAEKFLARR